MSRRESDPLDVIPTSKAVRQLLQRAEERAYKLRVLLKTAEQIEAPQVEVESSDSFQQGTEVSHAR